ncbi:Lysophospholipase 1 [Geranomyces michiganensis]|nr:Lysophospholipase 1 [Geranomyces michiganensis]
MVAEPVAAFEKDEDDGESNGDRRATLPTASPLPSTPPRPPPRVRIITPVRSLSAGIFEPSSSTSISFDSQAPTNSSASTNSSARAAASAEEFRTKLELSGEGYDDIVTRSVDGRVVLLIYIEDIELFDDIVVWKNLAIERGDVDIGPEDAMQCFADRPHADALSRIIFGPRSTEWDAILKYTLKQDRNKGRYARHKRHSNGTSPSNANHRSSSHVASRSISCETVEHTKRGLYMREMLLANLFLEIEVDADSEDKAERFVKIMAPFDALCKEAEKLRLRMALKPRRRPSSSTHRTTSTTAVLTHPLDPPTPTPTLLPASARWSFAMTVSRVTAYMFTLNPCPSNHLTTMFRRARLTLFAGGDPDDTAGGVPQVVWHFFNSARRSELVYSIMLHHTLSASMGYKIAAQTTIRDLLEQDIFTDWYPVHDCDSTRPGFGRRRRRASGVEKGEVGGEDADDDDEARDPKMRCMREKIYVAWVAAPIRTLWKAIITGENVEAIREYVGEQVAFYFDWMGTLINAFYTIWAVPAAVLGFCVLLYGMIRAFMMDVPALAAEVGVAATSLVSAPMLRLAVVFDNPATIFFSLGMSIWSTLFLEFWQRRQKYLSHIWSMTEYRREEQVRPQWTPSVVTHVGRHVERHDPYPFRILRRTLTTGVVALCMAALLGVVMAVIGWKAWAKQHNFGNRAVQWLAAGGASGVVEIAQVLVVQRLYYSLAWRLNSLDNFKYDSQFEDAFIFKTFIFNAVNNYGVFVYIGVVKAMLGAHFVFGRWPENCSALVGSSAGDETGVSCMQELTLQMAIIFVGLQFMRSAQKAVWPWVVQRVRSSIKDFTVGPVTPPTTHDAPAPSHKGPGHKRKSDTPIGPPATPLPAMSLSLHEIVVLPPPPPTRRLPPQTPQYVRDETLFEYDDDTLCEDYGMTVIQFGYIALFSCAFPVAPVFAILNNFVEIRVDSYKMLFEYRRPWAQRAQSIGLWTPIMTSISTISAPLNALVIAFSSMAFDRFAVSVAPENTLAVKLGFVIVFEHTVLGLKALCKLLVPTMPGVVKKAVRDELFAKTQTMMRFGQHHLLVLAASSTVALLVLITAVGAQVNPANLPLPSSYAPTVGQPCPSTPLIRTIKPNFTAFAASDPEREWVAKRDTVTAPLWTAYLNKNGVWDGSSSPAGFKPPRLAIAVSGGGLRAMTYGASILAALDSRTDPSPPNGGVLQLATYLAGLSGGSWLMSLLYLNNFLVLSNTSLQATWNPQVDIVTPGSSDISDSTFHRFIDSLGVYKDILQALQAKREAGFEIGFTDFWAGLIAAHLPPNVASADDSSAKDGFTPAWSSVENVIANATVPLPFLITSQRSPGESHVSVLANVWSSSPFETGSDNDAILAFMQTRYLGTNVTNGQPTTTTCTTNLDQTAFLAGASSSLFNVPIALLSNSTSKFSAISDIARDITNENQDTAEFRNPFFAVPTVNASISTAPTIELVDGGEGGQNIPLRPFLTRAQVILAIDSSADSEITYPNGTSLVVSAQYAQWMNDTPGMFPPIPKTPDAFVAQGLDRRVTVFGCGAAASASVVTRNRSYTGPVIIYIPSHGVGTNLTTFTLAHTPEQTSAFFDTANGVLANPGTKAPPSTCFACALLVPSFRSNPALISTACKECLDAWCWSGSDKGEPGWVGVPATKNYDGQSFPPPMIGSNVPTKLFSGGVEESAGGKAGRRTAAIVAGVVVVAMGFM